MPYGEVEVLALGRSGGAESQRLGRGAERQEERRGDREQDGGTIVQGLDGCPVSGAGLSMRPHVSTRFRCVHFWQLPYNSSFHSGSQDLWPPLWGESSTWSWGISLWADGEGLPDQPAGPAQAVQSGTSRKQVPGAGERDQPGPPDGWKEPGHGSWSDFPGFAPGHLCGRKEVLLGGVDEPSCPHRKGGPHPLI